MMIAGASLAFWLIITLLFVLRIVLSVYNWWSMRRLNERIKQIESED